MRVGLAIIGALIGWNLASPATHLFDLAVGAAVGFAIADLGILRARLNELGAQVARLTTELRRRNDAPPTPIQRPEPVGSSTLEALSSVVRALPLSPQDFAYGLPVITTQEAAAYRFPLPLTVYQDSVRADLSPLPATLPIAPAAVGPRQVLGGPTRLVGKPAAFPWTRAVLWGVLLAAVILLAWMAYRLANEPAR
jgi:hypothetical protein